MTLTDAEQVAVPDLHYGDMIHIQPHEVYRHTDDPVPVGHGEADVEVDGVIIIGCLVVICWGTCSGTCGSVVYDVDDRVLRVAVAHQDTPGRAA